MAVACRVLKLARQPYYRWLKDPVSAHDFREAYRANALFDAYRDDPEFWHRLLADHARQVGQEMADRTAWKITSANGWISQATRSGRGKDGRPGPAVHDDRCARIDAKGRVRHDFTAQGPNQVWLTDITEHPTREGKVYLCAIKDAYSNRIVGYSMSHTMTALGRKRLEQRREHAQQRCWLHPPQ